MNHNDVIAWSVAVIAVSFVVLCFFLIRLLRTTQSTIGEVKETVEGLQGEVKRLTETVADVTATVADVTEDIRGKLASTNPLFDAVRDVGVMLSDATGAAREASKGLTKALRKQAASLESGKEVPPAWLKWGAVGARIAIGLRKGWQEAATTAATADRHDLHEKINHPDHLYVNSRAYPPTETSYRE